MFSVGKRDAVGDAWSDERSLARTAAFLRGHEGFVPRGVYRFRSFEEADAWMTKAMIATHERPSRRTSSGSAGR